MTRRTIEVIAFCIALIVAALAVHAWLASRDDQHHLAATLAAQKQIIDSADTDERVRQASLADALAQIEKLKRTTQTPEQIVVALQKYLPLPQPITLSQPQPEHGTVTSASGAAHGAGLSGAEPGGGLPALSEALGSPDTESRAPRDTAFPKADVEAEGQGFSPVNNVGRAATSSLPETVAQEGPPSRRLVELGGSVGAPKQHSSSVATPTAPCDLAGNCSAQIPASDLKPLFDYVQDCRACQAQLAAAKQTSSDDAEKIDALTRERNAAITAAKGGTFFRRLKRNVVWFAIGAAAGFAAAKH